MSSKYFCVLTSLMATFLACSNSSQLVPMKSTEVDASYKAVRYCFEQCNSALPEGWYVQRLNVRHGKRPETCRDKIEALQAEIYNLQFELDKLQNECLE